MAFWHCCFIRRLMFMSENFGPWIQNELIMPLSVCIICIIIFCIRHSQVKCIVATSVCVCLSVSRCIPTLLHGPECNFGQWYEVPPPSCALLGGLAVGARVLLLWQHTRLMRNVSSDACTRCMAGDHVVKTCYSKSYNKVCIYASKFSS